MVGRKEKTKARTFRRDSNAAAIFCHESHVRDGWRSEKESLEDMDSNTLLRCPHSKNRFADNLPYSRTPSRASTVVCLTLRSESSISAESVRPSTTSLSASTSSPTSMNS